MPVASYRLLFSGQAVKGLRQAPPRLAGRIRIELGKLAADPYRRDIDVAPLINRAGYRLRVGGFRAVFERDDAAHTIKVLRIGPRGAVYRR